DSILHFGDTVFFYQNVQSVYPVLTVSDNVSAILYSDKDINRTSSDLFRHFGHCLFEILPCAKESDIKHSAKQIDRRSTDDIMDILDCSYNLIGKPITYGSVVYLRSLVNQSYLGVRQGDFGGYICLTNDIDFASFSIDPPAKQNQLNDNVCTGYKILLRNTQIQLFISANKDTIFEMFPQLDQQEENIQEEQTILAQNELDKNLWEEKFAPIKYGADRSVWTIVRFGKLHRNQQLISSILSSSQDTQTQQQQNIPSSVQSSQILRTHKLIHLDNIGVNASLASLHMRPYNMQLPYFATIFNRLKQNTHVQSKQQLSQTEKEIQQFLKAKLGRIDFSKIQLLNMKESMNLIRKYLKSRDEENEAQYESRVRRLAILCKIVLNNNNNIIKTIANQNKDSEKRNVDTLKAQQSNSQIVKEEWSCSVESVSRGMIQTRRGQYAIFREKCDNSRSIL
ncbi:MAG: hypothetical protein EZS28_042064, partial [Streblomastix strix]